MTQSLNAIQIKSNNSQLKLSNSGPIKLTSELARSAFEVKQSAVENVTQDETFNNTQHDVEKEAFTFESEEEENCVGYGDFMKKTITQNF